jgi:hypothetical protein
LQGNFGAWFVPGQSMASITARGTTSNYYFTVGAAPQGTAGNWVVGGNLSVAGTSTLSGQANIATSIVLKDGTVAVNPEASTFGAAGNGTTNDYTAIVAADAYAASVGMPLYLPHHYAIGHALAPKAQWIGVQGESEVIFPNYFVYGSLIAQAAIYNPHFSTTYNAGTADTLSFDGISFINNAPLTGGQRETMTFSNVNGLTVKNCSFTGSGNYSKVDIDLYGPVENADIFGDVFSDRQGGGSGSGGPFWILGLGATSADITNNIHFHDSVLSSNAGDEQIAVASANAPVQNITIDHLTVNDTGSDAFAITVFGTSSTATVNNVHMSDVALTSVATSAPIHVGLGGIYSATQNVYFDRISVTSNYTSGSPYAHVLDQGSIGLFVNNSNFYNTIGDTIVGNAISSLAGSNVTLTGNHITGNFSGAIANAAVARDNLINLGTLGTGISCAQLADGNTVTAVSPINCATAGTYKATGNILTVPSGAPNFTAAFYGSGGSAVNFLMDNNTIALNNSNHFVYNNTSTGGTGELRNTTITGTGGTTLTALTLFQNNSWYGVKDSPLVKDLVNQSTDPCRHQCDRQPLCCRNQWLADAWQGSARRYANRVGRGPS